MSETVDISESDGDAKPAPARPDTNVAHSPVSGAAPPFEQDTAPTNPAPAETPNASPSVSPDVTLDGSKPAQASTLTNDDVAAQPAPSASTTSTHQGAKLAAIAPTALAVLEALNSGGDAASIASRMAAPLAGLANPQAGQAVGLVQSASQMFGHTSGDSPSAASAGAVDVTPAPSGPPPFIDDHPSAGRSIQEDDSPPQFASAAHNDKADDSDPSNLIAAAMSGPVLFDESNRLLRIISPLQGEKRLYISRIEGAAALSEVGRYGLTLLSMSASIDLKEVLNKPITVFMKLAGRAELPIYGYVAAFSFVHTDGGVATYHAEVVPWLWYLSKRVNSRIYQKITVLDVLQKVFADYGALVDYDLRVMKTPKPVDYIVQYGESDLNFVSRLLETAGYYYYFEHRPDGVKLVIADDSTLSQCSPVQDHQAIVPYKTGNYVRDTDCVTSLSATRELQSGVVALNTFDYKHPSDKPYVEVPTLADQGKAPKLEVYDGNSAFAYANRSAGEDEGRRRMEVLEWQAKVFHATSDCRAMTVGHTFTMKQHFWFDGGGADGEFLIVDMRMDAQNNFQQHDGGSDVYRNHLTLIRRKIPYRPVERHEKPLMRGPQTATVVGPKGQEIHTDDMGRIKVQFPWDRYGKNDQGSSCWIRVSQPWAGRGWGTVAIPRINNEVIVDFLNGDPDRPVITGRLFNAEQTPPYALPDAAHQMGFHSRSTPGGNGFCEMVIHDKKGEELVNIHSQKDMATTVQNNQSTVVNGPHQVTFVTTGLKSTTVKKSISLQSQDEYIKATAKQDIEFQSQEQRILATAKHDIQLQSQEKMISAQAKQNVQVSSTDAAVVIEAKTNITLKVGDSTLTITPKGIAINGKLVQIMGPDGIHLNDS